MIPFTQNSTEGNIRVTESTLDGWQGLRMGRDLNGHKETFWEERNALCAIINVVIPTKLNVNCQFFLENQTEMSIKFVWIPFNTISNVALKTEVNALRSYSQTKFLTLFNYLYIMRNILEGKKNRVGVGAGIVAQR